MARRASLPVFFVALGLAGIASAGLLSTRTLPLDPGDPGSVLCGVTTTGPVSSSAQSTTAPTSPGCTTTEPTTTSANSTSTTTSTTTTPTTTTSSAASTLVITGHGWGHGMGMSQWGADGYAHHGWSAGRILEHYYQGTTISAGPSPAVRVLLADLKRRITLASESPWRVVDADGTAVALPAGKLVLAPALRVAGKKLVSPLTFSPGRSPAEFGTRPYRGKLVVISSGKRMQVVNKVALESYVDGVVGGEVPSTWPAEALEAQAIAARSYALAQVESVAAGNSFDVYSDTRSQVYEGIDAESPQVLNAVKATARQIVLYHGKVATTYFSASSGGRTVSAAEAIGTAIPYLVSVSDPYDTYSPVHDWGPVLFTASDAGKALGLTGPLLDLQTTPGPSDHNVSATAIGEGSQLTLTAAAVRDDLGLRSTWFEVGWLTLTPPSAPLEFGGTVTLAGSVRGVSGVTLESRTAGSDWQAAAPIDPDSAGAFTLRLSPRATTEYRLAAGTVRAAEVRIAVVPHVAASVEKGILQGSVTPVEAGSPVQLQKQAGSAWRTVAEGSTDPAGSFRLAARLAPGTYRVRCAPGHGLSPGLSPPLVVT